MTKSYLSHIDGLRAIAVLIVIMFHLDFPFLPGGYIGVDVFFVISGFLIVGTLKKELDTTGSLNFTDFYVRRFKRLTPALIITLLFTFFVAVIVFSPAHLQRVSGSLVSSIFNISNIYLWLEADYFDSSTKLKPFLHTWSLSIEWQFYFILPLVMYVFYKANLKKYFLTFLILVGLASLFLNYIFADGESLITNYSSWFAELIENGKSTIFYLLPFRIFEFAIGGGLVWCNSYKLPKILLYDLLFWLGLTFIAYSSLTFDDSYLFPYWFALVPCIGAALVIYSGGHALTNNVINNKLMVGIGLISYSLYLVHWPLIVFFAYINESYLNKSFDILEKGPLLVITFVLAYLLYRYIEQPCRKPFFFSNKFYYRFLSVSMLILLLFFSLHANRTGGWKWRTGSSLVNLEEVANAQDFKREYYGGAGYPRYGSISGGLPPDLILMGDSHARHYAEGLFKVIAKPNNLSLFSASGASCFYLPNFTRTTKGEPWDTKCPQSLNKALSYIQLTDSPVVVISHSWLSQLNRADLIDAYGKRRNIKINIEHVIQGLLSLKQKIGNAQLVVIGNVPTTGGHILYDIFTRPKALFFDYFNPQDYLYSVRNEKFEVVNLALKSAAEKTGEFLFIDPFDYLCDEDKCRNTDEKNRLLYVDSGHLSIYGSLFLIQKIEGKLMELIKVRQLNIENKR